MMRITAEQKGKGHWEVEFKDGLAGVAFYERSLNDVMISLVKSYEVFPREVAEIKWVED